MRLFTQFLALFLLVPFSSAQANKVGLTPNFMEAGSVFEGRSPETADMICSGVLVGCTTVMTAAHCLKYWHIGENRFWFYLQHAGLHELDRNGISLFCNSDECSEQSESIPDLALLRLVSPAWTTGAARPDGNYTEGKEVVARFVGYGIKPPRLDNYNIKRISPIRLSKCGAPAGEDHTLCSDLDYEIPTPCHKDSGGPLYAESEGGEHSLLGIAIRTGLGCRAGQAVYNDTTSPVVQAWLKEHIGQSTNRCNENAQAPTEILSEPTGWLDETSQFQELEIKVAYGLDELLVTMNHAPGENVGETHNNFDLELFGPSGPENNATSLIPYCDNTWKLLSVCRVPSPEHGTWKVRVIRKHGEGHFQLVASGISR